MAKETYVSLGHASGTQDPRIPCWNSLRPASRTHEELFAPGQPPGGGVHCLGNPQRPPVREGEGVGGAWTGDFAVPPCGSGPSPTMRSTSMSTGVSSLATKVQHRTLCCLKIPSWNLIFQIG